MKKFLCFMLVIAMMLSCIFTGEVVAAAQVPSADEELYEPENIRAYENFFNQKNVIAKDATLTESEENIITQEASPRSLNASVLPEIPLTYLTYTLENGEVTVCGSVDAIVYLDDTKSRKKGWGRLFGA